MTNIFLSPRIILLSGPDFMVGKQTFFLPPDFSGSHLFMMKKYDLNCFSYVITLKDKIIDNTVIEVTVKYIKWSQFAWAITSYKHILHYKLWFLYIKHVSIFINYDLSRTKWEIHGAVRSCCNMSMRILASVMRVPARFKNK